jgi:hypothetical protein
MEKVEYWYKKIPEIPSNLEPLTQLMIRTAGEANQYIRNHKTKRMEIVNSKNINLLHSIDRPPALEKLKKRVEFLKKNKELIKKMIKEDGYINLSSKFFEDSAIKSLRAESIIEIKKNKYVTQDGVGRIAAVKIVFPEGINLKLGVGQVDDCLKKRLNSINKLYIYGLRFKNLKHLNIDEKEIKLCKKKYSTKKCYRRGKYLKKKSKKFGHKIMPYL